MAGKYSAEWWEKIADINREISARHDPSSVVDDLIHRKEAEQIGEKLKGKSFVLLRQAGDRGQLYGSVSPRDIADVVTAGGFTIARTQVPIDKAIKTLGLHPISVVLHPEVRVSVIVNVARTEDEAERQARGEDVLAEQTDEEEVLANAQAVFEEGAGPKAEGEAAEAE